MYLLFVKSKCICSKYKIILSSIFYIHCKDNARILIVQVFFRLLTIHHLVLQLI